MIKNIRKKDRLHKKFKKTDDHTDYINFSALRASIKYQSKLLYKNFIRSTEEKVTNDPKLIWTYINSRKNRSRIPNIITDQQNLQQEGSDAVVNAFSTYFGSVYINSTPQDNGNFNNGSTSLEYVNIKSISEEDIIEAILKLNNKLTSGVDQIPSFIVKDCRSVFVRPLHMLFNLSLKTSTFPNIWKQARICPVFKKGDPTMVVNYRPISILSNLSKVFESILHKYISNAIKLNISISQNGFMERRSTITNLVTFCQYLSENMDTQIQTDAIFTDFSKAFDSIDHYILLQKLEKFGMSTSLLELFKSYLWNRYQFVEFQGVRSKYVVPTSGVPQGSNLGPLLFLIFIDDLPGLLNCRKLLFADDLKLCYKITSISDCHLLQNDIYTLVDWCKHNRLELNIDKCFIISHKY